MRFGHFACLLALAAAACAPARAPSDSEEPLRRLLASHSGKIVILLLGREGCPGTARATASMRALAESRPPGVSLLRIDVPLPKEQYHPKPWKGPFPRIVDVDRRLARELDFFFYPTLYVYDREGHLRFTGDCDREKTARMVREIAAEAAGAPKRSYTLPLPAVGEIAPPFPKETTAVGALETPLLRGTAGTLLVFARVGCPFTVEALPSIQATAENWRSRGMAVVVVNRGAPSEKVRSVYAKHAPRIPVIWDRAKAMHAAYGVDMTPFFFLLGREGKIAARRSYTPAAATGAICRLLGLPAKGPRYAPTAAG